MLCAFYTSAPCLGSVIWIPQMLLKLFSRKIDFAHLVFKHV